MKNIVDLTENNIFHTYSRFPLTLKKGLGAKVWDDNDRQYLDFVSGIAVCNLGHCHPAVIKAAKEQLEKLIHVSNLFYTQPQAELSEILKANSFADKIFFCNSGAEANEAAMKLARKYAFEQSKGKRFEIITMEYSFHGRTFATLTATGQEKFHKGFAPLLPGFKYVPFNDIEALEKAVSESTCAVMVEPIQGEGGVNLPSDDYFKKVRDLCDRQGVLLIFDEVQVGMGRTGKIFAYEHYGVEPDIMTLAKALAGGLPAGAMLANSKVAKSFVPGTHASTFGGNPVVMASAVAVMGELTEGDVLENCRNMGMYFMKRLEDIKGRFPAIVRQVRGKGLMIGMELKIDGRDIVDRCLDKGIIINCTLERILRFLPPLIVKKDEIDTCVNALEDIFADL